MNKLKLKLKDYISLNYLNKDIISKISNLFHTREPINYYVFDNFINEDLYKLVEEEFSKQENNFNKIDKREAHFISNKSVLLNTPNFMKLYNFFISESFELFLELFYKKKLKKYRKIKPNLIEKKLWIKWWAWVTQIYENWDFMWWHTDIAKDMQREKCIKKWWYSEWDKCIVSNFDEIWAFIYYVYNSDNNWDSSKWWVLELWKIIDNKIESYKEVFPLRNRLVIIKSSNKSYHRVTEVIWKDNYRVNIQDLLFDKFVEIWEETLL